MKPTNEEVEKLRGELAEATARIQVMRESLAWLLVESEFYLRVNGSWRQKEKYRKAQEAFSLSCGRDLLDEVERYKSALKTIVERGIMGAYPIADAALHPTKENEK